MKNLLIAAALTVATIVPSIASECGGASWYGPGFNGKKAASGEVFNQNELSAAHRSLPFGTRIEVINQVNGRSVIVRINDRGPFVRSRILDLSKAAAAHLGYVNRGVTHVCYRIL